MQTVTTKTILSKMRQQEIRTRRLVNDSLVGEYHSVFKGRGMDFDEVREYVAGDEVRTIDWNVTARAGRPFVKKYTEERELEFQQLQRENASLRDTNAAQLRAINLAREIISGHEATRRQMLTIEKLLEGKQIDMAAVPQADKSFKNAPNIKPSAKHRQRAQGNQESTPR